MNYADLQAFLTRKIRPKVPLGPRNSSRHISGLVFDETLLRPQGSLQRILASLNIASGAWKNEKSIEVMKWMNLMFSILR